ncbi:MAG: class I SAM-dependent methyltransferase [Polyangiaceae bacterium]|jgi:23S rRNA (cytosine1962-C5)-methyltransferase
MDRLRIWPDFDGAWIVHEDEDIIVVDKPVAVPSQAADPDRPDDIVTRLRRHLARGATAPYLGVHQRLDKDTSGLLVFARRREANATLAAQFEGRTVGKRYVAGVADWKGRDRATLRHAIASDGDGGMRVVPGRTRGAKEAVTRVRVLERKGHRALLELELETGRTHQARVQLAYVGAPIAGDALYGGATAPRLMLHASALAFAHPSGGRRVHFQARTPREFARWLDAGDRGEAIYDDDEAFAGVLDRALERRWGLGRGESGPRATTAFRLLNEAGDGTPRLAVDVYGDWLVAQLYGDDGLWADGVRRERVLDRLAALGFDGVYLKVRPKQANVLVDTRREEIAPRLPVRGVAAPEEFAILEEGTPLLVRLGDGLSTGLFLDQRANRRRIREMSPGTSAANLFSYTCAFTAVAAIAGWPHTVSVDVSAAALERGRANLANAGVLERGSHVLVADDVFAWLARTSKRGERFDLVIVDPPSYSTTKASRFVAETDYVDLAASALGLLASGGQLLACTNHRGTSAARFRRTLFDAARKACRDVVQVKDLTASLDFPEAPGAEPNMKSVLVTLRT